MEADGASCAALGSESNIASARERRLAVGVHPHRLSGGGLGYNESPGHVQLGMGQLHAAGVFSVYINIHRAQRNFITVAAGVCHYSDGISIIVFSMRGGGGSRCTDGAILHAE